MPTILGQYYRGFRMDEVCRCCRGNAHVVLNKFRCSLCKKSHKDYVDAGLEAEVEEFKYLHLTWIKCKAYKQVTTGIKKLDLVLVLVFGQPNPDFRQYHKTKQKIHDSPYIILRTVALGRGT